MKQVTLCSGEDDDLMGTAAFLVVLSSDGL